MELITLNTTYSLPSKGFWCEFTGLMFFLFAFSWFFSLIPDISLIGAFSFLFFLLIPLIFYLYLSYKCINFFVSDNNIIINSGIIFKKLKDIPFNSIQTKNLNTSPLQKLFGVSSLSIWTSSQSQIQIYRGNSKQRADGTLVLETNDANQLREMMTKK